MKIILLKDVKGVGKRFEEKEVSNGYADNYLLPKKLAVPATPAGLAQAKQAQEQSAAKHARENAEIEAKEKRREEKHQALEAFRKLQK